jgi:hypothetical protein
VLLAFESAVCDLDEAGTCLALERNTACVFHLMRATEGALKEIAAKYNVEISDPSWGGVLKRLEGLNEANDEFLRDVKLHLRAIKNAWRNPTMHLDKIFDQAEARAIFNALRGFLEHAAKKCQKSAA